MKRILLILITGIAVSSCASNEEHEESAAKMANRVKAHAELGGSYLVHNQLDIAQQELERALELNPDDPLSNNVMALLQIRLKDDAKAEQHFRHAIREQPEFSEARNNYAVFLCERSRYDEAIEQFRLAIKNPLYRTPEQANANAGLCMLRKGDRATAEKYFRSSLRNNPKYGPVLYQMAKLSFEARHYLSARGFIQRYFDVGRDTAEILLLAFRIERALNAKDGQAKYAVRLRGKFPESAEAKQLRTLRGF